MDRWLCAFLSGYGLTFWFRRPADEVTLICFAALAIGCVLLAYCTRLRTQLLGALLCGIVWGAGNAYFVQQQQLPFAQLESAMALELQVSDIVARYPGRWRITGTTELASGKYKVQLNWYRPQQEQAQRLPLQGEAWHFDVRLKPPQGTRNEGGMRYHRYLLSQGIDALGSIQNGHYLRGRPSWRQQWVQRLERALVDVPLAGVVLAVVVGERAQISTEQWQTVQRTGLAHLLAISGMHLSLVCGFALLAAWQLGTLSSRRRQQRERRNLWRWIPWLALPVALFYGWLAGFAIATLRALLMVAVVWLHKAMGWRVSGMRVLLRAVTLVLLLDPLAPLTTGFWLSVGAVASILLMNWRWRLVRGHGKSVKLKALWRFEWLLTLLFVPVMAALFGGVASAAALTNLVVVPLVTLWLVPLALLGLLLSAWQWLAAAQWVLRGAVAPLVELWPLLEYLAQQPWQWVSADKLPHWPWLVLLLLGLFWPARWRLRMGATALVLFAWLVSESMPPAPRLVMHVLDVEQGSALVLERQGHALIVDTAARWGSAAGMAERVILPFLARHRLHPEWAMVTHTDRDHQGGVARLQRAYPQLRWFGGDSSAPCLAGQRGEWRGVTWQVLHPRNAEDVGNALNNTSCVVLLQYKALRILLTGDIEKAAERQLLSQLAPLHADILLVPHHGSKSSSEDYFIRHVQPSLALVSAGRNSAYGHPHASVVKRYQQHRITLLQTAHGGQISVYSDGRKWWVERPEAAPQGRWFDADTHASIAQQASQ